MPSKGRRNKRIISGSVKFTCSRALPGSFERLHFLEELVDEFKSTDSTDYKEQVRTCSHCIFSRLWQIWRISLTIRETVLILGSWRYWIYSSIVWMRLLLFGANLVGPHLYVVPTLGINRNPAATESAVRLAELALGGIANLAAVSPTDRSSIVEHPKLIFVIAGLAASQPLIVIHCLTILIHLFTKSTSADSKNPSPLPDRFPAAVRAAQTYQQAVTSSTVNASTFLDPRIGILSRLLLEDCC
ncbi:uncharacterized protein DEA37_0014870 [Paragonimus westermani]|uniref:Uncharacterized protein n=1 Tax=Paragonimus westermani TaxID=34504 RepID=A0A5J4P320_9TREM|nr:uncharacterized protein DEA37_0014870 [Paragonimus westermani]